jgi:hypothetical protein
MHTKKLGAALAFLLSAVAMAAQQPAVAQTPEVKEKPPMYTYVSSFTFPRAKWTEVEKSNPTNDKIFDKAVSSGALVGYGDDTTVIHSADGYTHDTFWSGTSLAGVMGVLESLMGGVGTSPLLVAATKHEDALFITHYYNWKPGSFKGAYTHVAQYKLKDGAPDNAVEMISKSFGVPLFEKLMADGTLLEYEIDEEYIHTEAPGSFWVIYITKNAAGLDKVAAALNDAFGATPFVGPALDSMVDSSKHKDFLARTDGTYK